MVEYIERNALIAEFKRLTLGENSLVERLFADGVYAVIETFPAADVVEVAFCKDCRYYQDAKVNEKGFLICPASSMEIAETDYCSYGERMDKEDEHEAD